jgi:3-isopropylmalate/(R)-2-methylmalate dehydratase large subunit
MTAVQKIYARACQLEHVDIGQVIYPIPDLVIIHDGFVETAYRELTGLGYGKIASPERVMFVTDHEVSYGSQRAIERGRNIRRIAREWKVGSVYDVGRGGHGHIFPIEEGIIRPGMFIYTYDGHCTNFGAMGALATSVASETSTILATGTCWMRVPGTIRVTLKGRLRNSAHARDVGFVLAHGFTHHRWNVDHDSKAVEFRGPGLEQLDLASRVALCNSITEVGIVNVMMAPLPEYAGTAVSSDYLSDADAAYEAEIEIDLDDIAPQVSLPGGPDRAEVLEAVAGQHIDHAFIGACGSGMYQDFIDAMHAMKGQKIAPHVRLFVVPGSVATSQRLADEKVLQAFMDAGAIVLPPGCGPCAGGSMAPLGPDEVSIATAATNHSGRFGANEGRIYLASPVTVAASAVAGHIVASAVPTKGNQA